MAAKTVDEQLEALRERLKQCEADGEELKSWRRRISHDFKRLQDDFTAHDEEEQEEFEDEEDEEEEDDLDEELDDEVEEDDEDDEDEEEPDGNPRED